MNPIASAWIKDLQDRVKRASVDVNVALQPRINQAKRSIENSIQQIGLRPGKDIYEADYPLYETLRILDQLRQILSALATHAETHKNALLTLARADKLLSTSFSPDSQLSELLHTYASKDALAAHSAFVTAQHSAANTLQALAMDMSPPVIDLFRTFQHTYDSKIVPLKNRYHSQKAEWNRLRSQPEPHRFQQLIDTSAQLWRTTSDTLSAESTTLISYCTSKLSDWTLNVAQAKAETYATTASLYEQPAKMAEQAQKNS